VIGLRLGASDGAALIAVGSGIVVGGPVGGAEVLSPAATSVVGGLVLLASGPFPPGNCTSGVRIMLEPPLLK
jgi:hypothetical protein